MRGHTATVTSLAWAPNDERTLVSGSLDKRLMQWDAEGAGQVATYQGHADAVNAVLFTSDGMLVSGSLDRSVKVSVGPGGVDRRVIVAAPADRARGRVRGRGLLFFPDPSTNAAREC